MSNENNSCIPRLRFPGFEGKWVEKKLGDCLEERNEQFPESEDYPLMAFVAEKGVTPKGEKYDRSALVKDAANKKYKRTELGDFIYSSNNLESGSIGFNTYGSACISPVYSIFKSKNNVDSTFIGTLLTQKRLISEMVKYRQGVVYGQWKIPEKEFLGIRIFIPVLPEQQKIASCLSELDNLITAQGQKVDALKEKKKGLMQQLFPQPGETTPSLRFPGFEGEWEEKKLGEVASSFSGGTPKSGNPSYYGGSIPFIRSGEIHGKETALYITEEGLNNSSAKLVHKGDLLFALYGATSGEVDLSKIDGAINQAILCIRSKTLNASFLCNYLESEKEFVVSHFLQGGQGNLSGDIIMSLNTTYPSSAEQQKIASCLSSLDDLIAAESAKVEALKDHKKGLMQQLFPQGSEISRFSDTHLQRDAQERDEPLGDAQERDEPKQQTSKD